MTIDSDDELQRKALILTNKLIDQMGGTAKVGRLLNVSMCTVSRWRQRGIAVQYLFKFVDVANRQHIDVSAEQLKPGLFN